MTRVSSAHIFSVVALLAPSIVSADTVIDGASLVRAAHIFNAFAGVLFVAAFIAFVAGFIVWAVRYGKNSREEGIILMEWGVAMLFTLDVLLGIMHFVSGKPQAALYLVAIAALVLIVWIIKAAYFSGDSGEAKKEEKPSAKH